MPPLESALIVRWTRSRWTINPSSSRWSSASVSSSTLQILVAELNETRRTPRRAVKFLRTTAAAGDLVADRYRAMTAPLATIRRPWRTKRLMTKLTWTASAFGVVCARADAADVPPAPTDAVSSAMVARTPARTPVRSTFFVMPLPPCKETLSAPRLPCLQTPKPEATGQTWTPVLHDTRERTRLLRAEVEHLAAHGRDDLGCVPNARRGNGESDEPLFPTTPAVRQGLVRAAVEK